MAAPNREGWGCNPLREDLTAKNTGFRVYPLTTPWEVPEGQVCMVPVAFSAAREARAASGSGVAVVEPSAKTFGFWV